MCIVTTFTSAQSVNNNADFVGYFDGRTPCQEIAHQLNESTIPECWKIKWRLTLYKNGQIPLQVPFRWKVLSLEKIIF
jgi:hypothetical protein